MSLDHVCYVAQKKRVSPAAITSRVPRWQLIFTSADTRRRLPESKVLPAFCHVWGWLPKRALPDVDTLILSKDEPALLLLTKKDLIGCCELEVIETYRPEPDDLELVAAGRQRQMLAAATRRYETRTSAGSGATAWKLQQAICRGIARVAGGLLEDPQLGRFSYVTPAG